MLQTINKIMKDCLRIKKRNRDRARGQIAIILLVVISIVLMLVAVAINLGKISMTKTQMQITADSTAASLASNMASYSESLYRTIILPSRQTGDHGKNFGLTRRNSSERLSTMITIVICAVAIIISCICPPTSALTAPLLASGIIGGIVSTGALVYQTAVVEPMFQSMWAKQFKDLPYADQFIKMGTNFALQSAATDSVQIPDTGDYNMDGFYCQEDNPNCAYKTSRFGVKVTKGSTSTIPESAVNKAKRFGQTLASFMFSQNYASGLDRSIVIDPNYLLTAPDGVFVPDEWGVFDHDGIKGANTHDPSSTTLGDLDPCLTDNQCNPACIPQKSSYNSHVDLYSVYENLALTSGQTKCPGTTDIDPEICSDPNTPWCFAGDELYEDPDNTFESFRELIGRDDENMYLLGGMSKQLRDLNAVKLLAADKQFSSKDATGVYEALWKLYLTDLDKSTSPFQFVNGGECFWKTTDASGCEDTGLWELQSVGGNGPPPCAPNCYVRSNIDPLKVTGMTGNENLCYSDDEDVPEEDFFWKKGVNAYCNDYEPPYYMCDQKSCDAGSPNCEQNCQTPEAAEEACELYSCNEDEEGDSVPNQELWRSDRAETLRESEGIDDFVKFAYSLLRKTPNNLIRDLNSWYPIFLQWRDIYLPEWAERIDELQGFYQDFDTWTASEDPNYFCPKGCADSAACTKDEVATCLSTKKNVYDACLTDCTAANCTDIATELGVAFDSCSASFKQTAHLYREMFRYRGELLTSLTNDYDDLFTLGPDGKLTIARTNIYGFLSDYNINNNLLDLDASLNSGEWLGFDKGIYVWKDADEPDGTVGLWHVVRTDVKIPTRCNEQCFRDLEPDSKYNDGDNFPAEEPNFPEIVRWDRGGANVFHTLTDYNCKGRCGIHNYKENKNNYDKCGSGRRNKTSYKEDQVNGGDNNGNNKCFKGGLVGARVARYDQPRSQAFSWATNVEFWKTLFKNPSVATVVSPNINAVCSDYLDLGNPEGEAFFIVKRIAGGPEQNAPCWDHLNVLLNQGTQAISCAEYYCRMNSTAPSERGPNKSKDVAEETSMFGMRFTECPGGRPFITVP
ncbi:MAG: Tad domain-containing protein [Candidatus Aceula meridiana]|nr:Tad domain-containing protein [Candidatus Aceula meridiana]